jgi:Glycosyl transferase family 2
VRLSVYTAVKNGIANDLHVEAMLRHHLPLADEIVVNEGFSTDGTFERISAIDPKIRIVRTNWETPSSLQWCLAFKDTARRACTGNWCIHLDCDEFIPEWEFEAIRDHLAMTDDVMVPVAFTNFYGNYKVYHSAPAKVHWPARKMIIHRNRDDIEFWGDASNVRLRDVAFTWATSRRTFSVHHFGMVRHASILRQKWWIQGRAVAGRSTWLTPPKALFSLFPHNWADPDYLPDLSVYGGPYIAAVRQNPDEFVRDGFRLLDACPARAVTA